MKNTERQKNFEGFFFSTLNSITHKYTQTHTYTLKLLWSRFPFHHWSSAGIHASNFDTLFLDTKAFVWPFASAKKRSDDKTSDMSKKPIYTRRNFQINPPEPPKPLPSILSGPLSCASGKNVWWKRPNGEKERQARGAATEEDLRKPAGGNPTTKMRRGDMWCRRFYFFQHTD